MNGSVTQIKDVTGNPAPLGLLGFGMTTVLLNLHNAGFYELNTMILAMGICYGGAAQIVPARGAGRQGDNVIVREIQTGRHQWFYSSRNWFARASPARQERARGASAAKAGPGTRRGCRPRPRAA